MSTPDSNSKLVMKEKSLIEGSIDIKELSTNVGQICKLNDELISAAAGHVSGTEMSVQIYKLGNEVSMHCSLSTLTISNFRNMCMGIIHKPLTAYRYLLEGFEVKAMEIFKKVLTDAQQLQEEAKVLQTQLESVNEKLRQLIYKLDGEEDSRFSVTVFAILKNLSGIMMEAANYCNQLEYASTSILDTKINELVEKTLQKRNSKEMQLKMWQSKGFTIKAVMYLVKWVALSTTCTEYVENIQYTQRKLLGYIMDESATTEDQ